MINKVYDNDLIANETNSNFVFEREMTNMKFLKNNWLLLIFIIAGVFLVFYSYVFNENNIKNENKNYDDLKQVCLTNELYFNSEVCNEVMSGNYQITSQNFYVKFNNLTSSELANLNYLVFLVLFVISIYKVNNYFESKVSLLMLKREDYSKFIKTIISKMYRYVWIFPLLMLLIIGVCCINANFDISIPLATGIDFGETLMKSPILFILLYILNLLLLSSFFINISLMVVRKQHNYFLAVIESFLVIIGIELFMEEVVYQLFFNLLLKDYDTGLLFNIINPITFRVGECGGVARLLIFSFLCFLISAIGVMFIYHNKEKLVIDCEKNKDKEAK